jgi:hypothetical protein
LGCYKKVEGKGKVKKKDFLNLSLALTLVSSLNYFIEGILDNPHSTPFQ